MKKVVIIRASAKSEHIPYRFTIDISGKTILEHIVTRLRKSSFVDDIVIATTSESYEQPIFEQAERLGVSCYAGDYDYFLSRVYHAAHDAEAELVIKIQGNAPIIDVGEMDFLIEEHFRKNVKYSYNEHYHGIVYGMGCEIIDMQLLEHGYHHINAPHLRSEGTVVFKEILDAKDIFKPNYEEFRPNYRAAIFIPIDVVLISQYLAEYPDGGNYKEYIKFLDAHPSLVRLHEKASTPTEETGLEKLILFPEKLNNIQKAMTTGYDASYPISVELSLSNRCNLRCIYCSDMKLRNRSQTDLDLNVLNALLNDLKANGCHGIVIEGGGEPTLYPHFNKVIKIIRDIDLSVGLITNGLLMPYKDIINDFDWIRISLDAGDREEFLKLKGIDGFDKIMENIRYIAQQDTTCGVGYVVTKNNYKKLEELIYRLRRYDVDYIQLRPVIDHPKLRSDVNLDFLKKYSTPKFSIFLNPMTENLDHGNAGLPCLAHSLSTVVTADGDVFLCGRLNIHERWEALGNIYHHSFKDIWNGEKRKDQIEAVEDPILCKKMCPTCRMTKYNKLLNRAYNIRTKDFI